MSLEAKIQLLIFDFFEIFPMGYSKVEKYSVTKF